MRRLLALTMLLAGAAVPATPAPAADVVGIADQAAPMFQSPWFRQLDVRVSRLLVSYDAVLRGTDEVPRIDAWMYSATAMGIEPLIAFNFSRGCYVNGRIPHRAACRLPSVHRFKRAYLAFRNRYPTVSVYSPWNEINHHSQPTAKRPARAAAFYNLVRRECRGCTVVAADIHDQDGATRYLERFKRHAHGRPRLWGLHNYEDTNDFTRRRTRGILRAVRGKVWLTETGGIVHFGEHRPFDPQRAARATRFMFRLANMNPRITRLYIYQWTGAPLTARFDSGLTTPDGRPRPAFYVVRRHLRKPGGNPVPPPTEPPPPPPPADPPPAEPEQPCFIPPLVCP